MLSPSFQTSLLSKKIKKDLTAAPSLRRKCSDLLLPRTHFNILSELQSPNPLFQDIITSPRSAAIINFKEDPPQFTQNKLLKCSLVQKDVKEISKLFTRRSTNNQKEVFGKIDEIVGKLKQPMEMDFGMQMKEIKQLSNTQEQIVMQLVQGKNVESQEISKIFEEGKTNILFEEITNAKRQFKEQENLIEPTRKQFQEKIEQENLTVPIEIEPNFETNCPQINKMEHTNKFTGEFIENFDFKLNFSSPFKSPKGFDKENFRRDLTLEKKQWKMNRTPGNSTPCTTPLLERKRLLSSAKVEDMTDMSPKRDLIVDFDELLNELHHENEVKQWRCEEKEELDCLKEEKFLE